MRNFIASTLVILVSLLGPTSHAQMVPGISGVSFVAPSGLSCTGGTVTQTGFTRIHVFTASSTLNCLGSGSVNYLVVAGGGGGGTNATGVTDDGGGGGGGGFLTGSSILSVGSYAITVGAGGASGTNGSNSSIAALVVSTGGGAGGGTAASSPNGNNGGSGGGGSGGGAAGTYPGGTGVVGQGKAGGTGGTDAATYRNGGGGGGCSAVGSTPGAGSTTGGVGGAGCSSSITGTAVTYAGGGGGGSSTGGAGGAGGGGAGGSSSFNGSNATANTGGGGGGSGQGGATKIGGTGGSGIVIVSYTTRSLLQTCVAGNDGNTLAMLHMDGVNGGTSFPDTNVRGTGASWTATNATTSTTSPKFGTASYQGASTGGTSIRSNGSGATYNAGSGDFYIDFWLKGSSGLSTTLQYISGFGDSTLSTQSGWFIYYDTSKILRFNYQNTGVSNFQATATLATLFDGNWHYIMAVKNSSSVQIYFDGAAVGTPATPSGSMQTAGAQRLWVGAVPQTFGTSNPFQGNIDEFHYQLGAPASFAVPTLPYCN